MFDYIAIFRRLNGKGIRYIVVGGIAVNLHGIPRMTYDIDLLLDLEDKNIEKFLQLLKRWGFKPKVPVGIMDFAKRDKREDWIKNKHMKAFNLVNPEWAISEIDIVIDTSADFKERYGRCNRIDIQDVSIPVISVNDLIKMKQKANRQQDKADIRSLRKLKNGKK